jgi:hypothetical protein
MRTEKLKKESGVNFFCGWIVTGNQLKRAKTDNYFK